MPRNVFQGCFELNRCEPSTKSLQDSGEGEYCLYFQPQIELGQGAITTMEALIRCNHPTRGLLLPDAIIPFAESHGMIEGLGSWILSESCRCASQWLQESGMPITVAVNISPLQVMAGNLVEHVVHALSTYNLSPEMIELELTETMALPDTPEVMQTLDDLKTLGITLVLDDFGSGCADLDYLHRLPFDKVKLDKSWVKQLDGEDAMQQFKNVLDAVRVRGLRTTAEGIEDRLSLERLRHLGCDEVQGFFLAKPMPIQTLLSKLQNPQVLFELKARALGNELEGVCSTRF